MGPVRPEREDLHAGGEPGVEHPVVPQGRLMESVRLRKSRDGAGNAVTLRVLLEVEDAVTFAQELHRKPRFRPEQRRDEIREARRILKIAPLQYLEHVVVALDGIVRAQVLIAEQLGAVRGFGFDDECDDARGKLVCVAVQNTRTHSRGGTAALLAHRQLPDPALPAHELAAQRRGSDPAEHDVVGQVSHRAVPVRTLLINREPVADVHDQGTGDERHVRPDPGARHNPFP